MKKGMNFKEYLQRPVSEVHRANIVSLFQAPDTGALFLNELDVIRKKFDISDWKKEIVKAIDKFDGHANISNDSLRSASAAAMDFGALEAIFGDISGDLEEKKTETKKYIRQEPSIETLLNTRSPLRKPSLQQHTEPAPVPITKMPNFVNLDRRAIQVALQHQRTEKLFRIPVVGSTIKRLSEITQLARKVSAKQKMLPPQSLFTQAAALAQKLFAEIARNPESYVRLSQNETSALNSAKVTSISSAKSADPKAALRLAAINAMSQPPLSVPKKVEAYVTIAQNSTVTLQAAMNRLDDEHKKHQQDTRYAKETAVEIQLSKLGYNDAERARLIPILAKNAALSEYVSNGTIRSANDLESVLNASSASTPRKAKLVD